MFQKNNHDAGGTVILFFFMINMLIDIKLSMYRVNENADKQLTPAMLSASDVIRSDNLEP